MWWGVKQLIISVSARLLSQQAIIYLSQPRAMGNILYLDPLTHLPSLISLLLLAIARHGGRPSRLDSPQNSPGHDINEKDAPNYACNTNYRPLLYN